MTIWVFTVQFFQLFFIFENVIFKCWGAESKEGRKNFPHFFMNINVDFSPLRTQMHQQQLARDRYPAEIAAVPGRCIPEDSNAQSSWWCPGGDDLVSTWRDSFKRLRWQRHQTVTRAWEEENGGCYEVDVKTHLWRHVRHTLGFVPSYTTKLSVLLLGISLSHKCWKYSSLESEANCCVWHVKLTRSFSYL